MNIEYGEYLSENFNNFHEKFENKLNTEINKLNNDNE